jgi:hypothetical protein
MANAGDKHGCPSEGETMENVFDGVNHHPLMRRKSIFWTVRSYTQV